MKYGLFRWSNPSDIFIKEFIDTDGYNMTHVKSKAIAEKL